MTGTMATDDPGMRERAKRLCVDLHAACNAVHDEALCDSCQWATEALAAERKLALEEALEKARQEWCMPEGTGGKMLDALRALLSEEPKP